MELFCDKMSDGSLNAELRDIPILHFAEGGVVVIYLICTKLLSL